MELAEIQSTEAARLKLWIETMDKVTTYMRLILMELLGGCS